MVQCRSNLIRGPWREYKSGHSTSVVFLQYAGIDWYKYRDLVDSKYLVVFEGSGVILKVYEDIQEAFPGDFFTAEVDEIPEDFSVDKYRFGKDGFYVYTPTEEEVRAKNQRIVDAGCKRVAGDINTLTMLGNIGIRSPEEDARLEQLVTFVKTLRSVDLLNPVWPDLPD